MKKTLKNIFVIALLILSLLTLTACGKEEETDTKETQNEESKDNYSNIIYFENTNIPTPESVLNYNKPFVINDMLNDTGYYYASYSENSYGEYSSNVKGNEDYEKYSKILTDKSFNLDNTEDDGDAKVYTYHDKDYKVTLRIQEKVFEITINKNN